MSVKKLFLALFVWALGLVPAVAVELNPDHPDHYVVVPGDTLWDISGRFLRNPWDWPLIWEQNPQVENPHLIYPGDVLVLRFVDGQPVLSLSRDGQVPLGGRDVKLVPSVREYRRDQAIAPIPLDAIQQFLSRPLVLEKEDLELAPYVLANEEDHLVGGAGSRVFIRGLDRVDSLAYSIYREGEPIFDPEAGDDGEVLGFGAVHIGDIRLDRLGDPAIATVLTSNQEVNEGDRVLPLNDLRFPQFVPHAPDWDFEGTILSVADDFSQIGQYMVVTLNRGERDGLEPGHVLSIWQSGRMVEDDFGAQLERARAERKPMRATYYDSSTFDRLLSQLFTDIRNTKYALDRAVGEDKRLPAMQVQLPEERAGELMIFRTFERVSFGLVLNTQKPVHVLDKVRRP